MNPYPITGMILAAGFGTRLQSVLQGKPKPLIELKSGFTALDIAVQSFLKMTQIEQIIINTHYQSQQIEDHLVQYVNSPKQIIISKEEEILETGGGILKAMTEHYFSPYLVRNADAIFVDTACNILDILLDAWDDERMDTLLLLVPANTIKNHRGDFLLHDSGKIIKTEGENNAIYTGLSIISPRFFHGEAIHKFSISKIFFRSTTGNYENYRFFGIMLPNATTWYDIGTPTMLAQAQEYIKIHGDVGLQ